MNNKTALAIGMIILAFFAIDHLYLEWNAPLVIGQKLAELIEKMAIWR